MCCCGQYSPGCCSHFFMIQILPYSLFELDPAQQRQLGHLSHPRLCSDLQKRDQRPQTPRCTRSAHPSLARPPWGESPCGVCILGTSRKVLSSMTKPALFSSVPCPLHAAFYTRGSQGLCYVFTRFLLSQLELWTYSQVNETLLVLSTDNTLNFR